MRRLSARNWGSDSEPEGFEPPQMGGRSESAIAGPAQRLGIDYSSNRTAVPYARISAAPCIV